MMRNIFGLVLLSFAFSFLGCRDGKPSKPQQPETGFRKSPVAIAAVKSEKTYIKVVYGQPYRRNRTIFGEWEPYGEVWRTGANEATEITLTETVLMAGEVIQAGMYALFTIPYPDHWTIILNNTLGQWGAFSYTPETDYKRFDVPVIELETPVEAFTIAFSEVNTNTTTMTLSWDLVRVEIPIRFY